MQVLTLLKKNSFSVVGVGDLELPVEVVNNQEVKDPRKLETLVYDFIRNNNLTKNSVTLLLSEELIYQKNILLTDVSDEKHEMDKFLANIPFDPPSLATKIVKTETDLTLYAANKHLFFPFVRILTKLGWRILAVVPATAFPPTEEDSVLDPKLTAQTNFLVGEGQENPKPKLDFPPRTLALTIMLAVSVLIAGVVIMVSASNKKPAVSKPITPAAEVKEVVTAAATPAASFKEKSALTVRVLNGTGKAGDASKVATALEKIGLSHVETGNLEIQEAVKTLVSYSASVSASVQDEVNAALGQLFVNELVKIATSASAFDVSVVTGK
jgi:hypothetical protein